MTANSQPQGQPFGRLPILNLSPVVEAGRWPAKAYVGEVVPFQATVFREGHDALGAELLLTSPSRVQTIHRLKAGAPGSDQWGTSVLIKEQGRFLFQIRAFADEFETWHHNSTVKIAVGVDEDLMMLEGINLFTKAAAEETRSKANSKVLLAVAKGLADSKLSPKARLALAETAEVLDAIEAEPIRNLITLSETMQLISERERSGVGAWYEFFPRSEGAVFDQSSKTWTSGNFKTAALRLPAVAEMGFNVLYMPPIHPIGVAFRKGPNNTLNAGPQDPGSPWA
ncbi:MAG: hypothetical protein RI927_734, partial [Actinomycetota bacterium]